MYKISHGLWLEMIFIQGVVWVFSQPLASIFYHIFKWSFTISLSLCFNYSFLESMNDSYQNKINKKQNQIVWYEIN